MMRIARALSISKVAKSRRDGEKMIGLKRVFLNGSLLETPAVNVDVKKDQILVDGKRIQLQTNSLFVPELYLAYKLPGELITHAPSKQLVGKENTNFKPTFFERLESMGLPKGLKSAGRLDLHSEGLLVLSNNTDILDYLSSPSLKFPRVYHVHVYGHLVEHFCRVFKKGSAQSISILPALKVEVVSTKETARGEEREGRTKRESIVEVVLMEGQNREIRRVAEECRLVVTKLVRVKFGDFSVKGLKKGDVIKVKTVPRALMEGVERHVGARRAVAGRGVGAEAGDRAAAGEEAGAGANTLPRMEVRAEMRREIKKAQRGGMARAVGARISGRASVWQPAAAPKRKRGEKFES